MGDVERKGTRCAVCTGCGRCFEAPAEQPWSGERCEVCVSCGKCAQAWGLLSGSDDADATSGATSWADAFKVMDTGNGPAPPTLSSPPGVTAHEEDPQQTPETEVDATTGATPGVATACKELGLDDIQSVAAACGIKPPGQK